MSSIDDRIVNMQFNNDQFQKGISQTNDSLSELKGNLKLDGASDGIGKVQAAASKFSLANMESALDNVSSKFSVFGAVGFSVINNVVNTALDAGKRIAGALVDPIVQGGEKRAAALQQANFQFRGLGLDIDATMAAALAAVKGTAFGLDDAALAAGQFGASGITAGHGLETALRGVSGVAAQTGSSYESVAQIFEKVAGNGRLMGDDLLQLSSRGVNAAATLAKSMGTTEQSVREMVTDGKISFQQFSDAMNDAFGANATKANELYSGALSNMNAALARLGATFQGQKLNSLRDIFNALSPLIDNVTTALMPLIDAFNAMQAAGSAVAVNAIDHWFGPGLIVAIQNIVRAIMTIGKAISTGFHKIFPDDTENQLKAIALFLDNLTAALNPGAKAASELSRSFAGFFAIFDIAGRIIGAVFNALGKLFGIVSGGGGSFLSITANIGDFIVKIDEALKHGQVFSKFFGGLAAIFAVPISILKAFFGIIADGINTLTHLKTGSLDDFADDVSKRFQGLNELAQFFQGFWNGVIVVAKAVWSFLGPIFSAIGDWIGKAVAVIKDALSQLSFDKGIQILNTGIFAGILIAMNGFFGGLNNILKGNAAPFVSKFGQIFNILKTNLKALEMNTNAKTLKEIAISVALLAASAIALSLVDPVKLAAAMGAITGLLGGLIGAFAAFSKIETTKSSLKLLAIASAMEIIAGAILTLSLAVALLAALPFDRLAQGLGAIVVMLAALVGAVKLLAKSGPGVIFAAGAMTLMAGAIAVLAGAVALLSLVPFDSLVRGLAAVIVLMLALVVAVKSLGKLGPQTLASSASILLVANAMAVMAGAVAILGALDPDNMVRGIVGVAALLAILAIAMDAMDGSISGAAAMVIAAAAIVILAGALRIVAKMSWDDIGRSITVLAASLVILAIVLTAMGDPLVALGALALIVAAAAIAILAPMLVLLGTISWDSIGRGMTALGAALVILAVGGLLMIPASVGFLLLGAAIFLIGQGVGQAATGIALLATAIAALALVGAGGIAFMGMAIDLFIQKLPALGTGFGAAIVALVVAVGAQAPEMIQAFVNLILAMLSGIDQTVPAIINTATLLIISLVNALVILGPLLADAALELLVDFLDSIDNHMDRITAKGGDIIVKFIEGIGAQGVKIANAALDTIVKFTNGLADAITSHKGALKAAGGNLSDAIVDGMTGGLSSRVGDVVAAARRLANAIPQAIRNLLGIKSPSKVTTEIGEFTGEGMAIGVDNKTDRVDQAATDLGKTAINGLKNSISGISDFVSDNLDVAPTIRPVIDLNDVKTAFASISTLIPKPSISLDTSNDVATSVSLQEQAKNAQMVIDANKQDESTTQTVNFTQNNNSPKALSTSEIYRNTKNQLSTLKGDLDVVDQSGSS